MLRVIVCFFVFLVPLHTLFARDLRLGHGHSASHSWQKALEEGNKKLEKDTNGKLKLKIYPSAQLGNERQMQEQVAIGTLDMVVTGALSVFEPALSLFEFPFLYDNREQVFQVMYSDAMEEVNKGLEKRGVRILGFAAVGFRDVTSNIPLEDIDAYRGFTIRTPENPAQVETFRALGANPTPMSFSELYGALQQRVVDGQENPLENIYDGKFFEVQKYVNRTQHIYNWAYILVSEATYRSLKRNEQQALANAMKFVTEWTLQNDKNNDQKYEKLLEEKGMLFTHPDREKLKESTQAAFQSRFVKSLGERGERIVARVREIVAENQ